jgi:hypothetical protein
MPASSNAPMAAAVHDIQVHCSKTLWQCNQAVTQSPKTGFTRPSNSLFEKGKQAGMELPKFPFRYQPKKQVEEKCN